MAMNKERNEDDDDGVVIAALRMRDSCNGVKLNDYNFTRVLKKRKSDEGNGLWKKRQENKGVAMAKRNMRRAREKSIWCVYVES